MASAGDSGLLLTVLIGHIDFRDAGFNDKIGHRCGLAEHHHDLSGNLLVCRHHKIRAFNDQFHGRFKIKYSGTKKSRVFPYAVTDVRIGFKPLLMKVFMDGRRREENGRLGIFRQVQPVVIAKHDIQERIPPFSAENGFPLIHDAANNPLTCV